MSLQVLERQSQFRKIIPFPHIIPECRIIIAVSKEKEIPAITCIHCFLYSNGLFRARPVSDSDMTQSVTEVGGGEGGNIIS